MTVYVDPEQRCKPTSKWRWRHVVHLFVAPETDLEVLHTFAEKLGLRRVWFQDGSTMPHYDLTRTKADLAVSMGAEQLTREQTVQYIRMWRRCKGKV